MFLLLTNVEGRQNATMSYSTASGRKWYYRVSPSLQMSRESPDDSVVSAEDTEDLCIEIT